MMHIILGILFTFYVQFVENSPVLYNALNQVKEVIANTHNENISKNVQFFVFTRKNRVDEQQIWLNNDTSIKESNFNPSLMTKIVIHGWSKNYTSPMPTTVTNAFLDQGDYNVILVDYGNIAKHSYPIVLTKVNTVGRYIGAMIVYLQKDFIQLRNLTIVGHSLGAHVASAAARHANKMTKNKVLHIVGLDPAQPGFRLLDRKYRLNSKDAEQVEIIHTNSGIKGMHQSIGHLDFYPNAASTMEPGCGFEFTGSCAHARAYLYYAEALKRPTEWVGLKCHSSLKFMSNRCKGNPIAYFPLWTANFSRPHGTYFLITNYTEPFGLGLAGIHPHAFLKVFMRTK